MADQTIRLGPEYFPDPDTGRPIAGGSIYVGIPDLDPEVEINQKQISVLQENGSTVDVDQPLSTSAGGMPVYNGSTVTIIVDGQYSLKILNSLGSQKYYVPSAGESEAIENTVGKFEDLISLINVSTPSDDDTYAVLSFFDGLNKGGGEFYWDSTIDKATADGGTIVDPDNIGGFDGTIGTLAAYLTAQGGGVGFGCWLRLDDISPTVYWLGGVVDGVTDDTASLNKAMSTQDSVIVPGGTCIISSTLLIPDNFILSGESSALSIIKLADNSDTVMISNSEAVTGNSNITIRDIQFDGNKANQGAVSTPVGLFDLCINVTLIGVEAKDAKITSYDVGSYAQLTFQDCVECTIDNCVITGSDQATVGFYGEVSNYGHTVTNNTVDDCAAGIEGSYSNYSLVSGNTITNITLTGSLSWSGLKCRILSNYIETSNGTGIVCGHIDTPTQDASGSIVSGNTVVGPRVFGINIYGSSDVVVSGNTIERTSGNIEHSIYLLSCSNVVVSGNTINDGFTTNGGASGIFIDTSDLCIIKGNVINSPQGTTTGFGIRLFQLSPWTVVSDNVIKDGAGGGISVSADSGSSVVGNNIIGTIVGNGVEMSADNCNIFGNIINTGGTYGILVLLGRNVVSGNRIASFTTGIMTNAATDECSINSNTMSSLTTGINLPTGSDLNALVGNAFASTVTTPISDSGTNNKLAHNIGDATHQV